MTLQIEHAARSFGGVTAVEDVSFKVPKGDIVGLIGPNGAGKTTVVNLITGILRLDKGRVVVDGEDISLQTIVDVSQKGVCRTFQNVRLLRESTVLQNVMLGYHRHERSSFLDCVLGRPNAYRESRAVADKARALLEQVGMVRYADYEASSLAYGHQRRVEIARAMAASPKYILLDEPVAGMNDVEADELGQLFRKLAGSGIGILLIEHNMRFVTALCSTVNVLHTGKIIATGTPAEINRNPEVIAAYLGA